MTRTLFSPSTYSPISHRTSEPDVVWEQVTRVLFSSSVFLQYSCLLRTGGETDSRTLFSPSIYSPSSHRTLEPDVVGVLSLYTLLLRTLGSMASVRNLFVENQSEIRR